MVEEKDFYTAKVQTSAFVFENLLTRTTGHKAGMLTRVESIMDMNMEHFSFDHAR